MNGKQKIGYLYAVGAFLFWGLVPIYFKAVSNIPALEVLSNRVVWSVIFLAILLLSSKQYKFLKIIIQSPKELKILLITSLFISINWLTFIIAINTDRLVEASFGYFINPLVNVLLAFLFLKERLNLAQSFAVFLALLAVIYQIFTLKSFPYIALILAFSFAIYGLLRKKVNLPAMPGLFIETLLVSPAAISYMTYLDINSLSHLQANLSANTLLLVFAGFITVVPLIWFNAAATKIPYSTLGFIQYIGPTISFLLAVFIYNEPFNTHKLISFTLIWIALFVFTGNSYLKKSVCQKN